MIFEQDGGNFIMGVRNLSIPFGILLAERGLKMLIKKEYSVVASKQQPVKSVEKLESTRSTKSTKSAKTAKSPKKKEESSKSKGKKVAVKKGGACNSGCGLVGGNIGMPESILSNLNQLQSELSMLVNKN